MPHAEENDFESSTDGEFDDVIRNLFDEGVVLSTVRTSKPKIWTKPKNVAPSSPPKGQAGQEREMVQWFDQSSYWYV